jgi:gamma-glutamylcyclotransferase (GGCT)/AIG2-like uncharacterized protein YtfP
MSKLVFVYGTLKSGGKVRGLDGFPGATIVGKAKTTYPDYHMIDLGAFPGVLKNGEHHIQGEVWEVDEQTALELDMIEGYPDFYNKEKTETTQGRAWMYFLPGDQYRDYPKNGESENIAVEQDTLIWKA